MGGGRQWLVCRSRGEEKTVDFGTMWGQLAETCIIAKVVRFVLDYSLTKTERDKSISWDEKESDNCFAVLRNN